MNPLDAVKGYASLIKYVLIAAAIAATLGYTYHLGSANTAAIWSAKYEHREAEIAKATAAEISRQAQANAMAKAIEAKRLEQLAVDNAALELQIKGLSDEADADPDRDRPALSNSSRLRIDAVH
ncbi:hypothetical protein [Mesorhizobium sp. M00.F.Ca.ET.217.01.1.1]|uniref:hypothetical protein n=1 Tax=Mesorhizobium sp. M00.F.Ca.ET.217.01.1.1 TaxID=2500529 RepID=UPI000FDB7614|nr:hypothetical protein [Mesorhizobium sp. M00.F.Ca.ET.217.01.1.1]TGQ19343.1 hypothetical protein EN860_019640 [Mesorhizobium sp. M00.F.Ca.ET.217.01.1.1]